MSPDVQLTHGLICAPRAFSGVLPLQTVQTHLCLCAKYWLTVQGFANALHNRGEGVFVLDTVATNFFLTFPTLTVPDRWIFPRIEGG
jgi:hypothetical protein